MRTRFTLPVLGACALLAACEGQPGRDPTAPDAGAVRLEASIVSRGHPVVRIDGSTSPGASQRAFRRPDSDAAAAAAGTTTQCDAGVLVPDDEDPTILRPEGGLTGGTYDNIEVPPDQICVLDGVTVTNWVRAFAGAQLFIFSSEIGGDVEGLAARVVQLNSETTVGGNLDVRNAGGGIFASCAVDNSTIQGNLSCTDNDPGSPVIRGEAGTVTVGGSVNLEGNVIPPGNVLLLQSTNIGAHADVNKNTGGGFKSVNGNTVADKLECKKNDAPFVGGPNTASKTKGQCF